jgi:hypothetical protein
MTRGSVQHGEIVHDTRFSTGGRGTLGADLPIVQQTMLTAPALYQLNAAKSGRTLADYRQAESVGLFAIPVSTDAEAHLKAAYWAAVAAQLQPAQRGAFAAIAARRYALGAALAFKSALSESDSVVSVLRDTAREMSAYAATTQTRGIVDFLNDMGQSDVVLKRAQSGEGGSWFSSFLGETTQYAWLGVAAFTVALVLLARRE